MRTIYLDYNATTSLAPEVLRAMLPYLGEVFGNPSSIHSVGRRARASLDEFRERTAAAWRCKPGEVVFTGSGTEANNLAVVGTALAQRDRGRHLIASSIEHPSVLKALKRLAEKEKYELTLLKVDTFGRVDPADVQQAIRPDTTLVSVMAANNEVGTLQPVAEIGQICQKHGVPFHTDASQWFGKEPVSEISQFAADMVTFCPHKLFGPKGAGALFTRSPLKPAPVLLGGGQEGELRPGTENLAALAGMVEVVESSVVSPEFNREALTPMVTALEACSSASTGIRVVGPPQNGRLCNTVALTFEGCDSLSILAGLDLRGFCASGGSACSSGAVEPSHVLLAMGFSHDLATSMVRFSLGPDTTLTEIDLLLPALAEVVHQVRSCD